MRLAAGVIESSFERFRDCGNGARECVVYLSGPLDDPELVDRVDHPRHNASAHGYDVDGAWLTDYFPSLTSERRKVRMQVHTHPGSTFHSSRDDSLALVYVPGFFSLVIPNFALGKPGLDGSFLAVLDKTGRWRELDPMNELEIG